MLCAHKNEECSMFNFHVPVRKYKVNSGSSILRLKFILLNISAQIFVHILIIIIIQKYCILFMLISSIPTQKTTD